MNWFKKLFGAGAQWPPEDDMEEEVVKVFLSGKPTAVKTFKFDAIQSGDGECFCWLVDGKTLRAIDPEGFENEVGWKMREGVFDDRHEPTNEDIESWTNNPLKEFPLHPTDLFGISDRKVRTFEIRVREAL